jgi:hypothetical protein
MMKLRFASVLMVFAFVFGAVLAAEPIKSGPQVGDDVPGPFHPLNVTGAKAGEKNCLFCQNGQNPVVMIFAREQTDDLTALIKKVDACTEQNKDAKMGSFVVYLNDSEGLSDQLKKVAEKENIKNTILSIDNPAGPKSYNVSKEADVTVVLYVNRVVKANRAFRKDELKDKDIELIVADVPKILAKD